MVSVSERGISQDVEARRQDIAFIDCDTHFLPMKALQRLVSMHPTCFRLITERDYIRFIYNDRIVADGYAGDPTSGFTQADLDPDTKFVSQTLEAKVEQMGLEGPGGMQVLGYSQTMLNTMYPPGIGADVCRALNDGVVELLEGSSVRDRFIPVSAIYLPWIEAAVREIKRTHDLGFQAIFLGPIFEPYDDLNLGSHRMWKIYEVLEGFDMPVVYHSSNRPNKDWSSYDWKTVNATAMVGSNHPGISMVQDLALLLGLPFTYSCDVAALIFSGTLDRFPNLRFCLLEGRMPSFAPALMDALDQVDVKRLDYKIQRKPSEYFSHFYPAATANEKWLHHTVEAWPDHNIVIGSDYPHTDASGTWPNSVRLLRDNPHLSEADKDRILAGNARRLFNL